MAERDCMGSLSWLYPVRLQRHETVARAKQQEGKGIALQEPHFTAFDLRKPCGKTCSEPG